MSNIIDFSDYHCYTKEEIKEKATFVEEKLKELEKKDLSLKKDPYYFRLKNLFHATIEDMQNEEFNNQEIYLYFKGLKEIQDAHLDSYCQLVYSKLFNDFGDSFLNLDPSRKIQIIDAMTSVNICPDNYSVFASFLLDDEINQTLDEKVSVYQDKEDRRRMKKGIVEDLIMSAFNRVTTADEMLAYAQTELTKWDLKPESTDTALFPGIMTLDKVKDILQNNLQVASSLEIADAYSLLEKLSSIEELKNQSPASQTKFLQFAQGVGASEGISFFRKAEDILHISTHASEDPEYLIKSDVPKLFQDAINHQNAKQNEQHK